MKNILISALVIVLISVNFYLGQVNGSLSTAFASILVGVSAVLILFLTDYPLSLKYIFMNLVVISYDILIKFLSGGAHDAEAQGWLNVVFLSGAFISLPFALIYTLQLKTKMLRSFLYLFLSVLFLIAYLFYFGTLGTIDIIPPVEDSTIAKTKGLYISDVKFSENYFALEKDTFYIKNGWLQAQTRRNHLSLIKRIERTENNYCLLEINGKFDKSEIIRNVYYKVNDTDPSGSMPLQNIVSFPISKTDNEFEITLFNAKEKFKAFKKIIIRPAIY